MTYLGIMSILTWMLVMQYGPVGVRDYNTCRPAHTRNPLKVARVYLIDTSASMSQRVDGWRSPAKIDLLKTALQASLSHMATRNPHQRVNFVCFSDQAHQVFSRFLPCNDFRLQDFTYKLRPGGMTNGTAALEMGLAMLTNVPPDVRKQMTVISDGEFNVRTEELGRLLAKARNHHVAVWTISLAPQNKRTADEQLLRDIASATPGGRFFKVSDLNQMIAAFTRMRGR